MKARFFLVLAAAGAWAQSPTINDAPSRQFGQLRLQTTSGAPNLVEGRELSGPHSLAFDTSVSPPILYVADTNNNRVLAWENPAAKNPGDMADKVIGQRDFFSTVGLGPGTTLSSGLRIPSAVAVDRNGHLYVLDTGNNRILRYPQPFRQTGDLLTVDLVIGQRSIGSGNQPNQGQVQPSEKTLAFSQGGSAFSAGMTFDAAGNLWVADVANNRVLRFPASQLAPNTLEPASDIVLGQSTFTSNSVAPDPAGQCTNSWFCGSRNKNVLQRPSGLAFDQAGRLYVVDSRARALYFPVLATGVPAARVLGVPPRPAQGQTITFPNAYTVGAFTPQGQQIGTAEGVFTLGNDVFVVDQGDHRILRFEPAERWGPETDDAPSPRAVSVIGQTDFTSGKINRGQREPDGFAFSFPTAGAFLGTDLWIADTSNHRVLSLPSSGPLSYGAATRVLGQFGYAFNAPNLVEGRELWVTSGGTVGGAIVVDRNSTPPRLYIADTFNNRVLGFRDARHVGADARRILEQRADLIIGQPDLFRSSVNYPSSDPLIPSDTGLNLPTGLAVDAEGNLWVADTGNGRVLRFPSPFSQPQGTLHRASVVLGQVNFTAPPVKDAGISNMSAPFGLAVLSNGSLAVSDNAHNRVLIFRRPAGGDFANYQNAATVLGQPDFSSSAFGTQVNQMRNPTHIAVDTSDRLFVADSGNNRLMVFVNLATAGNGATSAFQLFNLNRLTGVTVSQVTGEIWLGVTGSNSVLRLPEFLQLQLNPNIQPTQILANGPIALALDSFDNLIVMEGINRVTFYYAKMVQQHAASYNVRPLAPGQLAYLYRLGKAFTFTPADGTESNPWPTQLGDVEVLVNGVNAPIFRVNESRIDFQVPMSSPSSGNADFEVRRVSTGEIIAATTIAMAPSNPGFFTSNAAGTGQAAAVNQDGTVNSPQNPVGRGQVISFYLTGQGRVDGAPPDGSPPTGPVSTPVKPVVLSPALGIVNPEFVEYSGLGAFAGGWQINFRVPEQIPPGNNNIIVVTLNDVPSNIGFNTAIQVVFAVR
jgi:uncharacterized protein (TIGR03437 family)